MGPRVRDLAFRELSPPILVVADRRSREALGEGLVTLDRRDAKTSCLGDDCERFFDHTKLNYSCKC